MIPSLSFKFTEGLANKHASITKFKHMLSKGVASLAIHWQCLQALDRHLHDGRGTAYDRHAVVMNRAVCLDVYRKSINLLRAVIEAYGLMVEFLQHFSISPEYGKILKKEILESRDKKALQEAEFVSYVCRSIFTLRCAES